MQSTIPPLNEMLQDMQQASPIHQPTHFWQICLKEIIQDLENQGLDNFKQHPSALKYFVQHHADSLVLQSPQEYASLHQEIAGFNERLGEAYQLLMSGQYKMEMDWRVFQAADDTSQTPSLQGIGEDAFGDPACPYQIDDHNFSVSLLSYLRKLVFLKKHADCSIIQNVLEIGGGYGTLGEILLKSSPDYFYLNVDIPPLAYVSAQYLKKVFGEDQVADYSQTRNLDTLDIDTLKKQYRAAVICPWQLPKVQGKFELFVNASSFQEMEPEVVENYSKEVNRLVTHYLLLKNSKCGKARAQNESQIGVKNPVLESDYLKYFSNFHLKAKDARVFGHTLPQTGFVAEVSLFKK